ncbi:lysine N(6)-hydroxylase/L-ornithine N(5)-oxygenase family protein [Halobacillus sp. A5]|uniref:lysine N(6)-hydroxylase/L-ornithine N(5)-oxygenase family protein n=1 Tax=Halobacillus sp. A5 TaxID=2880263 RepID=UPI0020A67537|nr:lysine N(6)-hydroxylase/L-ornithine N(5)-oxygenase family protein [Halobacillus sp. A5]MCP3028205.1 lysine N(6)-hydroxylase/L-ornithine N(5)-oxygenase family protein [Halobacillus sp. A5]
MMTHVHDVIGVGLGPFNLGLAAMSEESGQVDGLFFEQEPDFNWHPGMMIEGTTLQVPFFADLISLADVRSEFSFLNYLQEHGRMYHFYFLEKFHISRKEYNDYCQWAARRLSNCNFGSKVVEVHLNEWNGEQIYQVVVQNLARGNEKSYYTRNLAIGIGSVPFVPEHLKSQLGESVFHSSEYVYKKETVNQAEAITVVGSGQSSAEIFLDVIKEKGTEADIHWYTRSNGFFPMEYSKLGLEHFSPDYTRFFYQLSQSKKDELLNSQDLLYKGISAETISEIYDSLYEGTVGDKQMNTRLQAMSEIEHIECQDTVWKIAGRHLINGDNFQRHSDAVILGTGYKPAVPDFLSPISCHFHWDQHGRYEVEENYVIRSGLEANIYIQNGEMHTHGVGAPDLGLGAYRNSVIINSIAGREVFPIQEDYVFQTFGIQKANRRKGTHVIR